MKKMNNKQTIYDQFQNDEAHTAALYTIWYCTSTSGTVAYRSTV